MEELNYGGIRCVRDNPNEPWRFPNDQIIRKINLNGLVTYLKIAGEVLCDLPPKRF